MKKSKLLDALATLEWALETPVVPGEMERWTDTVQRALTEIDPLLRSAIDEEHPAKFKQIGEEDPGLLSRVDELKEQDQKSLEQSAAMRAQIEKLSNRAEAVEPDEARAEDRLEQFIDSGIAYVIHVRKQEVAIDTWLMEALDRDRGVVD